MSKYKRIFVIVTDSLGVGYLPDAKAYGDYGTNTLRHLSESKDDFKIPTLEALGIGNITKVNNTAYNYNPSASFAKMAEMSVGKDTLTGHWEMMGLNVTTKFPSFTENGFPQELIDLLEKETGHKFIGNIAASGTEIIKDLGQRHLETKELIIYTSADSVLQIAANENVIPLEELYRVCSIARKITLENTQWMVGRIIARPFIGTNKDNFTRTANRHDYAVKPIGLTVLNYLKDAGLDVIAIGKINDIFDGEGITDTTKITSNSDGMEKTIEKAKTDFHGLCFVNLVDFDALYGHRRNPVGYANCLEQFDKQLSTLLSLLNDDDLLMICADHGNDPTHTGTDHTREYVPLLVYNKNNTAVDLGTRSTFADIGATISENFKIKTLLGTSFLKEITNPDYNVTKTDWVFPTIGKTLKGCIWKKQYALKKGVILISHGMAEHIERYDEFATFLADKGYIIYAHNQRGHKNTEDDFENYGYMGDTDNFMIMVNDINEIVDYLKNEYPNLPLYLFGHSMGSFISQRFSQLYSPKIDGLILCGTSQMSNAIVTAGKMVASLVCKTKGRRYRSKLLDNMSFGAYNKKFKPNRTQYDWLNRVDFEVDKYILDPYCGGIFSASYFKDLMAGLKDINHNNDLIKKDLPILMISGDADPVGAMGKGPKKLAATYKKNFIKDVTLKLYPNARHELLLEENKDEVYQDVFNWLKSK